MVTRLVEFFTLKGYMRLVVKDSEDRIGVVFKITADGIYVVCLLDDRTAFLTGPEMVSHIASQVSKGAAGLFPDYAKKVDCLAVIISEMPDEAKKKLPGEVPSWIVNPITRQVMIYDEQPFSFYDARQVLEECLNRNPLTVKLMQLKAAFPPVTVALTLLSVLVFIILEILGDTNDAVFIMGHGGLTVTPGRLWPDTDPFGPWEILKRAGIWHLFTACFVHFGFRHLFMNMFIQLYLGGTLERIVGKVRFILIYLIAGVAGNLLTLYWDSYLGTRLVVTAGASGAICGLGGALAYVMLLDYLKGSRRISFWRLVVFMGLIVGQGVGQSGVNNLAHLGGFVGGFLAAVLLVHTKKGNRQAGPVREYIE